MTLKYAILILLSVPVFSNNHAQQTSAKQPTDTTYRYWAFKLPLANMIDFYSPNFVAGAEYRYSKHAAFQLLAGPSIDIGFDDATSHTRLNGFRTKAEYRWYFRLKRRVSFYFAADMFYTMYSTARQDSFISLASVTGYTDHYHILNKKFGSDIKWGFQKRFRNHFLMEAFAGFGYMRNVVSQYGRRAAPDALAPVRPPIDFNLHTAAPASGIFDILNVPMNFAIGYIFP